MVYVHTGESSTNIWFSMSCILCWIYFRQHKNILTFSAIYLHWHCTWSSNSSLWKIRPCLPCTVNTVTTDGLATQSTKTTGAIVLIWLSQNTILSARELSIDQAIFANYHLEGPRAPKISPWKAIYLLSGSRIGFKSKDLMCQNNVLLKFILWIWKYSISVRAFLTCYPAYTFTAVADVW